MMDFRDELLSQTPRYNENRIFTSSELFDSLVFMFDKHDIDELLFEIFLMVGVDLIEHTPIKPYNARIVKLVVI